jgi:Spy/CpxP family protein refolding chaperone
MRKLIMFTSGVAVVAVLGVAVVEAQRPGRNAAAGQAQVGPRGGARGPAFAQGRGGMQAGRRGGGPGFMGAGIAGGLDLTEAQRDALVDLQRGTRDQSAALADELTTARHALHRAIFADARNDAEVADLAAKVGTLEQQLQAIRLKSEIATADLLTAEQKEIVRTRPARGPGRGGRGR